MRSMLAIVSRMACAGAACAALWGCTDRPGMLPETEGPVPTTSVAPSAPVAAPPAAVPEQPNTTGADVGVAQSAQYGAYLVDATGRALYVLDRDKQGESSCYDACAAAWPPLLASQGSPRALDPALNQNALTAIRRRDGDAQVTYHGHPLYHEANDAIGQINGHGVSDDFGKWALVSPSGAAIAK